MKTNIQLLKNTQKYRKTAKGVLTNMYNHMVKRNKVFFELNTFQDKYLQDKKFIRLFKEWEKSNYNKQLKPSIDRIDNKKGYFFENMQMLTWAENRFKQSATDGKRGRKPQVIQMLGDKVIKIYQSQRHCVKELGISQSNLSSVLNGKRNYVNGYKFIYENPELLKFKKEINMTETYICNKDFPKLGLEVGDIFPAYKFTKQAIEEALKKNSIIKLI